MKFTLILCKKILFCSGLICLLACKNQPSSAKEDGKKENIKNDSSIADEAKGFSDINSNKAIKEKTKEDNAEFQHDDQDKTDDEVPMPKGFIIKNNAVLFESSSTKSNKIGILKKGENIYLMETSLNDDEGKLANYPTWYKVQLINKKIGWVESSKVSFGH
jgi:hypothetical protein